MRGDEPPGEFFSLFDIFVFLLLFVFRGSAISKLCMGIQVGHG